MKNKKIRTAIATTLLLIAAAAQAGSPPPALGTLGPGDFRDIQQDLNVNIVFIGFEAGVGVKDIDEDTLLSILPARYRPVQTPAWRTLPVPSTVCSSLVPVGDAGTMET